MSVNINRAKYEANELIDNIFHAMMEIRASGEVEINKKGAMYEGEIKCGGFVFSDCIGRLHDDAGKA
jgi:hypothetical protein